MKRPGVRDDGVSMIVSVAIILILKYLIFKYTLHRSTTYYFIEVHTYYILHTTYYILHTTCYVTHCILHICISAYLHILHRSSQIYVGDVPNLSFHIVLGTATRKQTLVYNFLKQIYDDVKAKMKSTATYLLSTAVFVLLILLHSFQCLQCFHPLHRTIYQIKPTTCTIVIVCIETSDVL